MAMQDKADCPLYTLSGVVIHGEGNGHTVGMPTANLSIAPGQALPPFGVYAARVRVGDREYCGVTNVGLRPTLTEGQTPTVETLLMDFSGDLYGREMRVSFLHFLRPERAFASAADLKAQIEADIEQAKSTF